MDNKFFEALFHDETEQFRSPSEPDPGDRVTILFRSKKYTVDHVHLVLESEGRRRTLPMKIKKTDELFDWYETSFVCREEKTLYSFLLDAKDERYEYTKSGIEKRSADGKAEMQGAFWFVPGFHVPAWSKGAIQYQIFTDRFRNGDPSNDVSNHEYYYVNGHSWHMPWQAPVMEPDIHNFYGGDLQGVIEKLDYLVELGVEVLYFNPLFVSPSSHKYDTQDYEHIDPHFGVILEDERHPMQDWEHHNGYASEYIRRVTSLVNLEASDRLFASLCEQAHNRGMKIILDGVFNHCGSFNKWMDREGIYVSLPNYEKGAYQSADSPYRSYFKFNGKGDHASYEGWWNYETLPKLNYDESAEVWEKILSVAEKWAKPPYCIDGWRLDMAADLGHCPEVNHRFWKEFRKRLKAVNPDLVIIAEHYGDPSAWLQGDQWDTVMNYDAFMEPVTYFLTGMEKHSDSFSSDLYQNGKAFFETMRQNMAKFQSPSMLCAMNELSNHDHSRFLTRTNHTAGRLVRSGSEAAGEGIRKSVMREAVVIQMTWPGAPTIYYGDEAGQVGWTDPDCRRTYPWGREDHELISLHRDLIALRQRHPVFSFGSVKELDAERGLIAYGRFDETEKAVIAVNNTEMPRKEDIPVNGIGAIDGDEFVCAFISDENGHRVTKESFKVQSGTLRLNLAPYSALVLLQKEKMPGRFS